MTQLLADREWCSRHKRSYRPAYLGATCSECKHEDLRGRRESRNQPRHISTIMRNK